MVVFDVNSKYSYERCIEYVNRILRIHGYDKTSNINILLDENNRKTVIEYFIRQIGIHKKFPTDILNLMIKLSVFDKISPVSIVVVANKMDCR